MNDEQNHGLSSSDSPKKISQVEEQLIYCDKVRNQLSNMIDRLNDRLSAVLRSPNPLTVGECEKEMSLTPIAEAIKKNGREIDFFVNRIRDIIDRLEV